MQSLKERIKQLNYFVYLNYLDVTVAVIISLMSNPQD